VPTAVMRLRARARRGRQLSKARAACTVRRPSGRRADGYYRCLACRAAAVVKRRRAVKRILVEEAGGSCRLCGYDRFPAALQFHHVDPTQKSFSLSHRGVTIALDAARAEAAKRVLLCANCHAEVEGGFEASR